MILEIKNRLRRKKRNLKRVRSSKVFGTFKEGYKTIHRLNHRKTRFALKYSLDGKIILKDRFLVGYSREN